MLEHEVTPPVAANVLLYAPSSRQDVAYHDLCYTNCAALAGTKTNSFIKDRKKPNRKQLNNKTNKKPTKKKPNPKEKKEKKKSTFIIINVYILNSKIFISWTLIFEVNNALISGL